jgi:hypothetical protein
LLTVDETGQVELHRVEGFRRLVDQLPDDMTLSQWLNMMRGLQEVAFGAHYDDFEDDYRGDSMLMNLYALVCEVVEMGDEMGWKPWSSPRGFINREPALIELVDQMHFQGNLAAHGKYTGEEVGRALKAKALKNLQRQLDGYDTRKNKCPSCHRDLSKIRSAGNYVCFCGANIHLNSDRTTTIID